MIFIKVCNMAIFFITGTSGSGKSTLKDFLQLHLSKELYSIYDFDEQGVPENADEAWRRETTDYWLKKGFENSLQSKSTVICGVSVPSEIMNSICKPNVPIYFGFLKISDDIIRARLQQRQWNSQLIEDNINWAHYLESEVEKHQDNFIIDCSLLSPYAIAEKVIEWIEFCNN